MFGLSMDGPGRRTADPVPDEITRYPAFDRTLWPSIERFWLLAQTTQNSGRGLYFFGAGGSVGEYGGDCVLEDASGGRAPEGLVGVVGIAATSEVVEGACWGGN